MLIINNITNITYELESMDRLLDLLKKEGIKSRPIALITYSLENLNHSQKTLFGYALKGRTGQKGFLHSLNGEPVGRNNVMIPIENLNTIKEFFATWKVEYKVRKLIEVE